MKSATVVCGTDGGRSCTRTLTASLSTYTGILNGLPLQTKTRLILWARSYRCAVLPSTISINTHLRVLWNWTLLTSRRFNFISCSRNCWTFPTSGRDGSTLKSTTSVFCLTPLIFTGTEHERGSEYVRTLRVATVNCLGISLEVPSEISPENNSENLPEIVLEIFSGMISELSLGTPRAISPGHASGIPTIFCRGSFWDSSGISPAIL